MPSVPTVRGSLQALYPVTRRVIFNTGVTVNSDGSEKRWARSAPLFEFDLQYSNISGADRDALISMLTTQKGMFGTNLSLTLGGTTYSNLTLASDSAKFTERARKVYDVSFRMRQTQNRAFSYPTVAASYPLYSNASAARLPWSADARSLTTCGDSATGFRFSYTWVGITGFPSRQLRRWSLTDSLLSDTEAQAIENLFLFSRGRRDLFQLVEPDTSTYYDNVRFASDVLEIKYLENRKTSMTFDLIETN